MPRKKRSYSETTDLQCHEEEVEKGKEKGWISVKKKRSGPDVCIVISDSDDGEENHTEENGLQKKRETRKEEREKMLAKRRISQMTEEEQLAMAVQMSKQEANQLNSQQVEEDELLKKAIAESLNACQLCSVSFTYKKNTSLNLSPWTLPQLNSQTGSQTPYSFRKISPRKLFVESEKCLKEQYQRSDEESLECQKVLSKEDINGSQIEQEDFVESGLLKRSRRNLTFKHCSRQSEDLETQQNSRKRKYVNKPFLQPEKSNIKPRNSLSQEPFSKDDDGGIVHYYWGIPFCPKGADPDQYTKVILCQLEVYEKSLKQAQKQLLRKVEYGNPVLPQSNAFPSWRRERGKAEQSLEDDDEITGEKSSKNSDEEDKEVEDSLWDWYLFFFSIYSKPSLRLFVLLAFEALDLHLKCSSQSLFAEETPEEEECTQRKNKSNESLEQTRKALNASKILQLYFRHIVERCTYCGMQNASWLNPISYTRGDTKVRTENPAADEEAAGAASVVNNDIEDVPIASTSTEKYMECPLCRQKFPLEKIEAHAAYCSDMGAEEEMLTRRQRGRRNETNDTFISSKRCEKCYVCKSLVSSEEYQNHVDNCLKTDTDTQKSRRTKRVKVRVTAPCSPNTHWYIKKLTSPTDNGGRLLVLLDQSELRTTGGDRNKLSNQNLFNKPKAEIGRATMENELSDSPDHLNLSDSPIRSFTSISEASNCLIDFKQQFASRSSSGKENKARRGRRKRH
uniref:BRCA1-A complex subunit RAP80 n=1 Tax=Latimeria chalumnae TaxID=7897 RepID=H3AEY4_LATCH